MKRGTVNEEAVLCTLCLQEYIRAVYEVGLIGMKQEPWVAASPDAICLGEVTKILYLICAEKYTTACVEITTGVCADFLKRATTNASLD